MILIVFRAAKRPVLAHTADGPKDLRHRASRESDSAIPHLVRWEDLYDGIHPISWPSRDIQRALLYGSQLLLDLTGVAHFCGMFHAEAPRDVSGAF